MRSATLSPTTPSYWRRSKMRAFKTRCISRWTLKALVTQRSAPALDTATRKHEVCVMKTASRMKNVTLSLADDVASWARIEAAKAGKSLSRFLSDLLAQQRISEENQSLAMKRFLDGPEFAGISGARPSREELYAERLFHRHERVPVRKRPKSADKASAVKKVAGASRRKAVGRNKSAGAK